MTFASDKPIVLVFVNWYLPGFRGGGPTRTIANMVDRMGDEFDFRIVTRDRDFRDACPYASIKVDAWNQVGKARVFYASSAFRSLRNYSRLMRDTPHDVLYLNSFFSPAFTLIPLLARKFGMASRAPVVVAPRGEFSKEALRLKRWKKNPYTRLVRWLGLFNDVLWHASTDLEAADIRRVVAVTSTRIQVARNLSPASRELTRDEPAIDTARNDSSPDRLRICFLSRISPMKNLDYALRVLAQVRCPVEFHIFGPKEVPAYWEKCQELMARLPPNILVSVKGSVENSQVRSVVAEYDLFFVPSRGENFGHVFIEALSAGVPILVSDQTPWRDLKDQKLGWDIPLDQPAEFVRAVEESANFDVLTRAKMRARCISFARGKAEDTEAMEINKSLFLTAIGKNRCCSALEKK